MKRGELKIRRGEATGFTLVEVMVVIALIMIVSAIAFPMVGKMAPNYRLRSVARNLVADFQKARLEAIKRNRWVVLEFTSGVYTPEGRVGSYRVCEDANKNKACDAAETVLVTQAMPQSVTLYSTNFSVNVNGKPATGYNQRGLPLSASGHVKVRITNRSYLLSLSNNGFVSLASAEF